MISMKNLRSLRYFNLKFLMFLFFILNLFFNFSVIIHAQSNYYEIILPKKVNGIESVQYYIDGTPKGSTDGTNSIKIKENSKINFSVKFEGSGYNQTKLEDLKLRNSSNNIIKFNIYTKDENNNIILSEVDKNEFINPEQEYISSEVTINSDNKFYFSNLKQDLYDINIYSDLENITKNLDIKYRVITENNINNPGDFNSNCTFNTNNKSFQVTGVLPDSTVELLITPDEAYSQSNFKVFNNNQEIQPDKNIYRIININSNLNININNLEKNKYNVNFADNNLSLISDSNQIIHGENFEFTYNSTIPGNQVVTANNIIIKPDENNIYKIKNIRGDQEIKLTSKDEAVHMISFENISDYYNITDINDNIIDKLEVKDGASASFKLELKDAYSGSLGQDEILSEVLYNNNNNNHKIIYESGFYKINNITSSLNIYAEGLQKNKYILKLGGDLENITSYNITINNTNIISNNNTIEIEHGGTIEIDFEVQNGYETSHTYISTYPKIENITGSGNNFVINNITSNLFVNINKIYKISTENEDIKIYTTPKLQKTHNNKIKYNLSSDINLNNNIIDQIAGSIDFSRLNIFSGISELENTIQNTENLDLLKENYNQEQIIKDLEKKSEDYKEKVITENLKFKIPNDSIGEGSDNVVHAAEIAYAAEPNVIYTSDGQKNNMYRYGFSRPYILWNGVSSTNSLFDVYYLKDYEPTIKNSKKRWSEFSVSDLINSGYFKCCNASENKTFLMDNHYDDNAYVIVPKNDYHLMFYAVDALIDIESIQESENTNRLNSDLEEAWVISNIYSGNAINVYLKVNSVSMKLMTDSGICDFDSAGLSNKVNYACFWQAGENVKSLESFRKNITIDDQIYYKTTINNLNDSTNSYSFKMVISPYSDDVYGIAQVNVMCGGTQIDVIDVIDVIGDGYQWGKSVNSVFSVSRDYQEKNAMNITFRKDKYLELVAEKNLAYQDPVFVIHPGGKGYAEIKNQLFIKYETTNMLKNAKVINPNVIDIKETVLTFTGGLDDGGKANCTEKLFSDNISNKSYVHAIYEINESYEEYITNDNKLYVLIEAEDTYKKSGCPTVDVPGVRVFTDVKCNESTEYKDKNGETKKLNVDDDLKVEGVVLELDLTKLGYWTSIDIGDTWIKAKKVNLYFLDSPGTEFRYCYPSRDTTNSRADASYPDTSTLFVGSKVVDMTDLPLNTSYRFFITKNDPKYTNKFSVSYESESGYSRINTPGEKVLRSRDKRTYDESGKDIGSYWYNWREGGPTLGAYFVIQGVNKLTMNTTDGETINSDGTTKANTSTGTHTFGEACDGYVRVGHPTQNLYFSVYRERNPINIKFPTNLVGINLIDSSSNVVYSESNNETKNVEGGKLTNGNYSTTKSVISFNIVPVPGYEVPDNAIVYLTDKDGRMSRITEHNGKYIIIDPPDGSTVNVDYTPKLSNFDLYFTPYEGVEYLDENRNPIGSDKTSVEYGESKSFIVNLDNTSYFSGSIENLEVTAVSETFSNTLSINDADIDITKPYLTKDDNGLYTIHNIDDNYRILISGLEVNTYTVEFLPFEDITYYNQYGTEVLKNETVEIQNISEDSNVTENEISGKEEQNPDSDTDETNENIKIIVPYNGSLGFKVIPHEGVDDSNIVVWCLTEDKLDSRTNAEKLTPTGDNTYFINNISQDCKIRVENTKKLEYKVTLRPAEGVSYVSPENEILKDDVTVSYGDNLEFGLVFAEDYNKSIPKVYIKGTETELSKNKDNLYVLENITENKTIEVLGVSKNTYTVRFEDTEGVIYKTMKNKPFEGSLESEYGEDLQFMITLMDAYNKSVPTVMLNNSEIISENGGIYTVEKISDDTVISVKDIVKNPEELTIEDILSIPDQITSSTDVNKVISATKSYDSLSEEDKIFVINSGKLEKAQESCKSINHISDNITVTGLDWNLKLLVTDLSYDKELMESLNQELDRKTLLSLYDIKLINLFDNQEYEIPYGQEVTVVIPHVNTSGYENIVVVHKNSGGGIEYLNADVSEDNIQFKTSSFSQFGVAGKKIPNYVEDPSEITISVADLVTDTDELQTLLGEGLSSQLGEIINIDNTGSNTVSSGSKNNNITENNSNWANKIYTWLINNELTAVILVIFIGFLIISLMWFFGTQNKNQD